MIFIVSAPSGAGKTTLCDRLQAEFQSLHYAVTATTRSPREGEVDGKSYYFLTTEDFAQRLQSDGFLESAVVHGFQYGSPRAPVEQALAGGRDVLMNLDVQGAASVRAYVAALPEGDVLKRAVVDIFVVPPSLEVLKKRLVQRGKDSDAVIERRLRQAEEEISHWRAYKYMVVNDDLAEAYDNMRAIILAERHRISNRAEDPL